MYVQGSGKQAITDVVLLHDGDRHARKLAALLRRRFTVIAYKFGQSNSQKIPSGRAPVFSMSKVDPGELPAIRQAANQFDAKPIFVFPTLNSRNLELTTPLAREIFVAPYDMQALTDTIRAVCNELVEASWSTLGANEATALKTSLVGFESMMRATARGEKMPLADISNACENIQKGIVDSSVDRWLGALQDHHDSTFRHCMFVCGSLSYFAHSLGIGGMDLKELTLGGFLHDTGKARVPHAILDKAGKLDPEEWEIMKSHVDHSRDILSHEQGLDPRIVAMAAYHHEKLDGTGYPEGLSGSQINDHVRLTAISDVFSALIEPRAYKDPMSNQAALDMMMGFKGHLDLSLVRRFREFMLDSLQSNAA